MSPSAPLEAERRHLAELLEALQRCVYFLEASRRKIPWPLSATYLEEHRKDVEVFESLAAINERFAKLQDSLGAGMRHAALLSGESVDTFLRVLAFYEKTGVIESVEKWQLYRATRNLAAHDYELAHTEIAEHFNSLNELLPSLYADADRFHSYCRDSLKVEPVRGEFAGEFDSIIGLRDESSG